MKPPLPDSLFTEMEAQFNGDSSVETWPLRLADVEC